MKKRLRFFHDGLLGYLLQIHYKFVEPNNGNYILTLKITDTAKLASLADINNIIKVNVTTSIATKELQQTFIKRKAIYQATYVLSSHPNSNVYENEEADFLDKLLTNQIGYEIPVSKENLNTINQKYFEIHNTLVYSIKIPTSNVSKLKKYIDKYAKAYAEKELEMQELLPLPKNYAEPLIEKITIPEFISTFGTKRLHLQNFENNEKDKYFFHSILYLLKEGKIKINNICMYNVDFGKVEIDNLTQNTNNVLLDQEPYWQDDFVWEGNKFIFGNYGFIDFDSNERKILFQELTKAKGNWVKVSELGKTANSVRPTISQIEKRFDLNLKKHVSIPSTKDDDLIGKPDGQGAYRIKFDPKA